MEAVTYRAKISDAIRGKNAVDRSNTKDEPYQRPLKR